jgi:hypothetical protein
LNPMTDAGPREMLPPIAAAASVSIISGVHVGYGRGGSDPQSRIRPWNVVEPVLWLANLSVEAR